MASPEVPQLQLKKGKRRVSGGSWGGGSWKQGGSGKERMEEAYVRSKCASLTSPAKGGRYLELPKPTKDPANFHVPITPISQANGDSLHFTPEQMPCKLVLRTFLQNQGTVDGDLAAWSLPAHPYRGHGMPLGATAQAAHPKGRPCLFKKDWVSLYR